MIPYRQMVPWYDNPPDYAQTVDDYKLFRRSAPGAEHVMFAEDDPRLSPVGDVARRGTIPAYVPFAVINPGRIGSTPQ